MRFIIFGLAMAAAAASHAGERTEWNPPARYDRPFDGKLTIARLPQWRVPGACRALFAGAGLNITVTPTQKGCAVAMGRRCSVIIIARAYRGVTPEAVLRHEIGHCNGWSNNHEE